MYSKKSGWLLILSLLVAGLLAACGEQTSAPVTIVQLPQQSPTNFATSAPAPTTAASTTANPTTAAPSTTRTNPATAPVTTNPATIVAPQVTTARPATTTATQSATPRPEQTTIPPALQPDATPTPPANFRPFDTNRETFLDDRTNPVQVLRSLYNAVNRKEYVRAFSYWQFNTPDYQSFEKGYQTTTSVELQVGDYIQGGAAAGTTYFAVPVLLKSAKSDGKTELFAGCYQLAQPNPANFGGANFTSISIRDAKLSAIGQESEANAVVAGSCQEGARPFTFPPVPATDAEATDKLKFLDDRTNPVAVIRSFYNAINRNEYSRAYYYFADSATSRPAFDAFAKGYTDTAKVEIRTGKPTSDGAAGSIYTKVPIMLQAFGGDGSVKYFGGCYVVRQVQPANFGTPPFKPMGIEQANIKAAPDANSATQLMLGQCGA
jgi:hypothetical protein